MALAAAVLATQVALAQGVALVAPANDTEFCALQPEHQAFLAKDREGHRAQFLDKAWRARLLKAAGAWDAINVDGGGSSTLVRYEQPRGRVVIDNRHAPFRRFYRNVSVNLGCY